jgi:hypothetical protein
MEWVQEDSMAEWRKVLLYLRVFSPSGDLIGLARKLGCVDSVACVGTHSISNQNSFARNRARLPTVAHVSGLPILSVLLLLNQLLQPSC